MKSDTHTHIFLLSIMLILSIMPAKAQSLSESRHIEKSFPVTKESSVEITNKYGMINVETWNYDSVKFVIDYSATARDRESLDKMIRNIDFQFINTSHYIVAKTLFINPSRMIINDIKSMFSSGSRGPNINYKMYVPKNINLKIENRYGDVFTPYLNGNTSISLSYGNLKAFQFDGILHLNLEYAGSVSIDKVAKADINSTFSNFTINKAGNISLESDFSNIDIGEAESIESASSYDKMNISEVRSMNFKGKFTKISIGYLGNNFDGNANFGTINFYKLSSSFSRIQLRAKYTDLNINFDESNNGFDIEITNQKSRLMYPREFNLKEEVVDAKESLYKSSGHIGLLTEKSKVYINSYYGNISIIKK